MQGTETWRAGEGVVPLHPHWAAHFPFLILERLKCNDDPFPSFVEGSLPCHSQARGPKTGPRGKLERPAVASPNTLGDQIYLMVKGLPQI